MISETQRQFIEASARVLWPRLRRDVCARSEYPQGSEWCHTHDTYLGTDAERCYGADRTPPFETQQEALMYAAMLLGAIQEANGCELEEIVRAASEAERKTAFCSQCGQLITDAACGPTHAARWAEYVSDFARVLTLQALGEPVRWEDEHAAFVIQRGLQDWRLVVPSIRLEKETAGVKG